ncbi:aldehyde dehydrogenase [Aminobacter anthyllidis]|uniref:Aldehyde dehydrogenase n=1 Tax=Aminobacter anthyllidis TaxID=1035067 RepID=A0A9X1AH52_9HYPH|nr:aldehyde dehydrogenase [Aminobacter anthyllidis]MBT1159674.1 aldehyde dehydrogenase [Aminobacter anthyllidis]
MTELKFIDWKNKAASVQFRDKAYIDGKFVSARSGAKFVDINPATDEILSEIASCGAEEVDLAVASARRSFKSGVWSRAEPGFRKEVLLRLAGLLRDNLHELAVLESLDTGKLVNDAVNIDVPSSAAIFQWYAEAIDKVYDEVAPAGERNLALVRREPLGVIGAVVAWNFPLDLATWKCAPALAAGNSVVLKPAEQSPLTALRLAELASEAGLPDGVLNVVPGLGETAGQALGRHNDVDCLAFTGSTNVGKLFMGYSGQSNMKPVWLETGGKSPNIIFADCSNLDAAADMAAMGVFFNQGQVCSSNSRLLVQREIKDQLLEKLVQRAAAMQPGDPLDPASKMGAMISAGHTSNVMRFVNEGKRTTRCIAGGEQVKINGRGSFVQPTIFDNVALDNPLAVEEIFGPVLSIIPFDNENEAVRIANDSPYGLAASLWTDSLSRAHRLSRELQVGTVSVNTVDAVSPLTPFGGVKQSGFGRDLSLHALDKYTSLKTVWIKY